MEHNKLIAPRLCTWCHEPFTPVHPSRRFCPKPARCAYQWLSQQRKGIAPHAAIAKRRQQKGQAAAAALSERFGTLTDRELEIYGVGQRDGYDDGYQACYAPMRRKAS